MFAVTAIEKSRLLPVTVEIARGDEDEKQLWPALVAYAEVKFIPDSQNGKSDDK